MLEIGVGQILHVSDCLGVRVRGQHHVVTELIAKRLGLGMVVVLAIQSGLVGETRVEGDLFDRQRITPPWIGRGGLPHHVTAGDRRSIRRLDKTKRVAEIVDGHPVDHDADRPSAVPRFDCGIGRETRQA
jgi:hypothetical protein